MTFNAEAKGQLVSLSDGDRRATREIKSFRDGLKVCLRIERAVVGWHGALRIGFTSVAPGSRTLPSLAIPDLTASEGYWAIPVPEHQCLPGSALRFWVCRSGCLRVQTGDGVTHMTRTEVNTHKPIWAMIDVYGNATDSVFLSLFLLQDQRRRACSAHADHTYTLSLHSSGNERLEDCVVCCSVPASILLACGHRCLCAQCASRVFREFGTCPLCRQCLGPVYTLCRAAL
uniref:Uncharacterized protein n=1 Tax=Electrophorus electricus TaxID=8005 RepID=A0AAY5F3A5_ELEEL